MTTNIKELELEKENMLVRMLIKNYQQYDDKRVALCRKEFGVWRRYSWKEYYEKVKGFSLGLISLGLKPGDKVSIVGENQPEWLWTTLAAHAARAVIVGIYPDCIPSEVKYIVEHSDSAFVVAEDQEQVDKVLEIRDEIPKVKKVIYWDQEGMYGYSDPFIMYYYDVVKLGLEYEKTHPELFERNIERVELDDIAVFCYTSGTTGLPKGAMLSHHYLTESIKSWVSRDRWLHDDQYLSYLNPAWATEWVLGYTQGLRTGAIINFPEKPETVQNDVREVAPQVILYGARMWESLSSTVQAKISDTNRLYRLLYDTIMPIGYKVCDVYLVGEKLSLFWRILYLLGDWLLFRPLRDKLGLMKIRWAYTGGAGMSPDIVRFFQAIGINLKSYYGATEVGATTMPRDGEVKSETTGPPFPREQVRTSDDGEILIRTKHSAVGYYKNPDAFKDMFDENGWFHSGDAGYFDEDGQLIVLDRVASLIELGEGHKFPPDFIETRLRFSPYVKDAMSLGGKGKPYVTVIIVLDFDNVGRWAIKHRLAYTTFSDLSQKPEVAELVLPIVKGVNKTLPDWARIKKYVLLHKEFDPDEAELTRTRKLRRSFMEEKYKSLMDGMYTDNRQIEVDAQVTYRDGRAGFTKTNINVTYVD